MQAPLPMLAKSAKRSATDIPQVPEGDGWIIEPKYDGWRGLFVVGADRVRTFGGRNGADHSRADTMPHERAMEWLPEGTVLDGELLVPGGHSTDVSTELASGGHNLQVVIFDVLAVAGESIMEQPWSSRREYLDKISEGFDGERVSLSPAHPADQQLHDEWVAAGWEGSVAKRTASKYRPGRRSADWIKVKPQQTAEAKIVGFVEGKNGRAGEVGAFELEMLDDGATTTCGTHTDAQREQIKRDPSAFMGKIIEIRHHGLRNGVPRHPVFFRMREDRDDAPAVAAPAPVAPKQQSRRAPDPIDTPDYVDSPVRSSSGRIRNVGSMNPAKFALTRTQMRDYETVDPEGFAAVEQEYADRLSGRARKGLI